MDKRAIISIICAAVLVVATGAYFTLRSEPELNGITAMDGYELVKSLIEESYGNSTIVLFTANALNNANISNGMSEGWQYIFEVEQQVNYKVFVINVFSNMAYEIIHTGSSTLPLDQWGAYSPINNWSLDSDEAYEIALSNEEVNNYMVNNPKGEFIRLESVHTHPVWKIGWIYYFSVNSPKYAEVHISAETGEIVYLDVDY